jgi:hypothetical protein
LLAGTYGYGSDIVGFLVEAVTGLTFEQYWCVYYHIYGHLLLQCTR